HDARDGFHLGAVFRRGARAPLVLHPRDQLGAHRGLAGHARFHLLARALLVLEPALGFLADRARLLGRALRLRDRLARTLGVVAGQLARPALCFRARFALDFDLRFHFGARTLFGLLARRAFGFRPRLGHFPRRTLR